MQGQKGGAWAKDQEKTWIGPTLSSAVKPLLKKGYDDIFAQTAAGMLLITLATVSFQALKAALMNPVKSLRNE
jgi:hypothetical protein